MRFLDLDELVERCRIATSRVYIKEATDCYHVGAFRGCVIMTWIAFVYDVIDKLRELALTGDAAATKRVQEFDEIQRKGDTDGALKFEREIVSIIHNEFQFITAQEMTDLNRLHQDRNRCGHPNLNRDTDPYVPSAELARLHLRVVVEHVIQRPPVQGKAAIEHLQKEVDSDYFPTEIAEAEKVLKATPLGRLKPKAIGEFVLGALSSTIREKIPRKKAQQRIAAAIVARKMHSAHVVPILREKIDGIIGKTTDEFMGHVIWLIYTDPELQAFLSEATWTKLISFIRHFSVTTYRLTLNRALQVDRLRDTAIQRIETLTTEDITTLVSADSSIMKTDHLARKCIADYGSCASYDSANHYASKIIQPSLPFLNTKQLVQVIETCKNSQIRGSFEFTNTLTKIKELKILKLDDFQKAFSGVEMLPQHTDFVTLPDADAKASLDEDAIPF